MDGAIIKRIDQRAESLRAILRAFERQGWPAWIANPIKPDHDKDDRQRLADAVRRLNDKHKKRLIRFRRDGRGTGVIWELVAKKKKARKKS